MLWLSLLNGGTKIKKVMEIGSKVRFTESVYEGKWPHGHFAGQRIVTGIIVSEKYRKDHQKQFKIKIESCVGVAPIEEGKYVIRSLKNILKSKK